MIVYCLFTQQSVGKLFAAGILPGLLTATIYAFLIILRVRRNPDLVKSTTTELEVNTRERIKALWTMTPIMFIAFVVLGGIYGGFFTPTEAAAVGCAVTLAMGLIQNTLRSQSLVRQALRESAITASMIFIIIISALLFSRFLAITQLPTQLAVWVTGLQVPRFVILLGILAIWFVLGIVMVPDGIYAVTLPIFFPLILKLGYDPIWFGIITIKLSEIANVTPPVGLNIFAIQGVAGDDVEITDVYKGVWPFVACDVIVLALLIGLPDIVLFLPKLIFG
jgi:tripartite ATP-independent transporter DctM subunit